MDPAKINLGLAYYGRTYKLADPSCNTMNQCGFTGPGAAGECTAFEGVLSNREIRSMIEEGGYKPYLNKTAMVKYMTYGGDNWVGFDDSETIAMKEDFANSMCLGGTMIWSIDFDASAGAGGGTGSAGKDLVWVSQPLTSYDSGLLLSSNSSVKDRSYDLEHGKANSHLRLPVHSSPATVYQDNNDNTVPSSDCD